MATNIINNNPNLVQTLKIETTQVLPRVLPTIAIGDVLRLNVRQNLGGRGLLYFKGQLLQANLPETLKSGDKLQAQVQSQDNQLVLKILNVETPAKTSATSAVSQVQTPTAENTISSQLLSLRATKPASRS